MKFMTLIKAPADQTRAAFQSWFASSFVPRLSAEAPNIRGGVFRDVIDSPGTPMDRISAIPDPDFGDYDILLETWFSSTEDFRREILPLLKDLSTRHISCLVTPRPQLDPRITESGAAGKRPEITVVCVIKWRDDRSPRQASQAWLRHAAIALRAQRAITKYEQNVVDEVISWGSGAEAIDALADFSFATVADCQAGFVATPEERQDTAGFVRAGRFLYLGDARPIKG